MIQRKTVRGVGVKKFREAGGIYVGRGRGSVMGNPFIIGRDGNREEVIEKFRRYLWEKIKAQDSQVLTFFSTLNDGDVIGCWCRDDEACHTDVIISCFNYLRGIPATAPGGGNPLHVTRILLATKEVS